MRCFTVVTAIVRGASAFSASLIWLLYSRAESPGFASARMRSIGNIASSWSRNDAMLDAGDAAVGVWVPGRRQGGTHGCLTKAAQRGMPGIHLDPEACGVRHRLPPLAELGPREQWSKP
mgnify:CR=1 FL=1